MQILRFKKKTQKFVGVSNKEGVVQGGSELTYETPRLPSYYMRVRFKMSSSHYISISRGKQKEKKNRVKMAFQIPRESSLVKFHRAPFCLQTRK